MHGHEPQLPQWIESLMNAFGLVFVLLVVGMVVFMTGLLPIPVGYERGKVKWVMWCGTGMHAHIVYLTDEGFQTLHPADASSNTP